MKSSTGFVFVGSLKNPDTGKTWSQENAEKTHNIPLGAIVECLSYVGQDGEDTNQHTGLRLFVVEHIRDFDKTPLYSLSYMPLDEYVERTRLLTTFKLTWADSLMKRNVTAPANVLINYCINGISEESLNVIKLPIKKE